MKTSKSYMAVACSLALAVIAFLGLGGEAFAATGHAAGASLGDSLLGLAPYAASLVAAIRLDIEALTKRAAEKLAEVKDGMPADEVRKKEDEHAALLREIEKKKIELAEAERAEKAEKEKPAGTQTPAPQDPPPAPSQYRGEIADAIRAERERGDKIRELAATARLATFGDEHVRAGTSVDAFRGLLLDKLIAGEGAPVNSNVRVQVGTEDSEKRGAAIESALLHRSDPSAFKLSDEGRNFRGMSLMEIARDVLESRGVNTRGMSRMEIAERALTFRSGGLHSTSDFPMILANVANKRLRAAYEAMPQTFRPIVNIASVPDFKAVSRVQMGEAPEFEKVNEHGEFKRGTIGEGREQYSIATYGKVVGITRQVIINDDLDAFSRIPAAFGVQAAQLESDIVWAQIIGNPTMGDNVALFHASHANLGSAAAIGVDAVSAGRLAMGTQTGLDGKTVLNLDPAFIIVPKALETKAEQFFADIYPATTSNAVPNSLRRMQIIAEPRLDRGISRFSITGSATNWYLAGNPAVCPIVELAYLDGNQGVYTETRTGFDVDGVEIKVRMDVGAKAMDHRNIWKNPYAG